MQNSDKYIKEAMAEIRRYYTSHEMSFKKLRYDLDDFTQDIMVIITKVGWEKVPEYHATFKNYLRKTCRCIYLRRIRHLVSRPALDFEVDSESLSGDLTIQDWGCVTPSDVSVGELLKKLVDRMPTDPVFRGMSYRDILLNYIETGSFVKSTHTNNNGVNVRIRQEIMFLAKDVLTV